MENLKLSRNVYSQILAAIGQRPPECGGVLGADESGNITEFYFDNNGRSLPNGYIPDVQTINEMLTNDWMPRGIVMAGIVHSHANGISVPSCGDFNYGIHILNALDTVDRFYLPIVTTVNGRTELNCFVICHDPERQFVCRKITYEIFDDESTRG